MTFEAAYKKLSKYPNFRLLGWNKSTDSNYGYIHFKNATPSCVSFTTFEQALELAEKDKNSQKTDEE